MDDRNVMRHLHNDNDISWVCQFCAEPFAWDVHPEVILYHLTSICERAPEDVKEAVRRSEEDEFSISISVEGNGSNFNAITECSRNAEREVEAAECSISVNWEPARIPDASENNDSNFEAEAESNIVQRSNKRPRSTPDALPFVAALKVPIVECVQDSGESASLTKRLVGDAFKRNEEKIWSWLMDDQVLRLGIYGMGGVGKTTLMRHIQTRLERESSIELYWITVSQDFSIFKLQNLIAKEIGLSFSDEEDEMKRAKVLAQAMHAKRKCVLILDDLWNYFDADEVGIPIGVNLCKVVLTTRLLQVCRQMSCSEGNTIQLQTLSEEDAWILFTQELGNYSTEVKELAVAVCRECDGLPLGIKVMARSMKGILNVHTWRSMLEELKESKVSKGHEMREEVFPVLKFSYLRLNDPALQECLSYCALFPEDAKIYREDLIKYMIVEGIIDAKKNRQAEFDKGHTMLDTLENACLLEGDEYSTNVWMHDLIRDMVILELREGSKTLVEAGVQLTELPDMEKWTENLVRVSLMHNDIKVIPSGHTPRCLNLSTLLLRKNVGLKMIADSFFEQFQSLKILDLSMCYGIKELPRSITDLVNLTALLLCGCCSLIHVPSLAKLEKLKKLDLSGCGKLKEMPEGVRFLSNLKYLDLATTGIEEIGSGIIPMLSQLQVLILFVEWGIHQISIQGSEVGELRMLETLHCLFSNVGEFGEYIKSREISQQSLTEYSIFVGNSQWSNGPNSRSRKIVKVNRDNFIVPLALPTDIEVLKITRCRSTLCESLFPPKVSLVNLQEILVDYLPDVEEIFTMNKGEENAEGSAFPFSNYHSHLCQRLPPPSLLTVTPLLNNLQEIGVCDWDAIEEIFAMKEGENGEGSAFPFSNYSSSSISNLSLLNLKIISIWRCHKLKKLFPPILLPNLYNLQKISVEFCNGMEEIFSTDQEEDNGLHLPRLTALELHKLPELRSIYKGAVICHSLQNIELVQCPKLKRIPLPLPQHSLQSIKVYPEAWWDSVQWGSASDKNHLESLTVFKDFLTKSLSSLCFSQSSKPYNYDIFDVAFMSN